VDLAGVRPAYVQLIQRLRRAGIPVSDRRAVKLQRVVAASAILCGRQSATTADLWVLRYIWDTEEQQQVLAAIVQEAVDRSDPAALAQSHPRARNAAAPDPEELARDFDRLRERLRDPALDDGDRAALRDQLGLLAGRCQWVIDAQQRQHLEQQVAALWSECGVGA
jgi:MoxR-like ATPase